MKHLLLFSACVSCVLFSSAQLGGIGEKLRNKIPNTEDLFKGKAPIYTSLEDAKWEVTTIGDYRLDSLNKKGLLQLQRTPNGGFVLQPGFYDYHGQSYCLKAGTHGPGGGDGYIYAPPKGTQEDAVMTILRNSVNHPEIQQRNIQMLLWAIIARSKFDELQNELKMVAARLLTPRQLAMLNRNGMNILPDAALNKLKESVPEPVQRVMEAENKLRSMLSDPTASFAEMERVAVLAGAVGLGPGSREVPMGRWSLHPDGYYVRYLPRGYSYTVVQVWVPNGSPAVGKEYDPATHIAVPGNTSRQRLIQSGRPHQQ